MSMSRILITFAVLVLSTSAWAKKTPELDLSACGDDPTCAEVGLKVVTENPNLAQNIESAFSGFASQGDTGKQQLIREASLNPTEAFKDNASPASRSDSSDTSQGNFE